MEIHEVLINDEVFQIEIANSFIERLVGLLLHKTLDEKNGLLLKNCKQVHTFFMKFPIDVIFIDKNNKIIHFESDMNKNRISKFIKNASKILELKAGTVNKYNIKINDSIMIRNFCESLGAGEPFPHYISK